MSPKSSGHYWLLSPRPHIKKVSRGGVVVVVVVVRSVESARACPCAHLRAINQAATLEPVLQVAESIRSLVLQRQVSGV